MQSLKLLRRFSLLRHGESADISTLHFWILALFLVTLAGFYSTPLVDHDFWWHAASGKVIVTTGQIPSQDPFGVFSAADQIRTNTVLKGQWLGAVILYELYQSLGDNAVVAFRVCILIGCILLVYLRCRLLNASMTFAWPLLLLVGFLAGQFGGERPQLLSFIFATSSFLIIDWVEKTSDRRLLALLPVIACIWANCHGGVILGGVLLGLWSTIKFFTKTCDRAEKMAWLAVSVAFVLASLATPNGFLTYLYLFDLESSELQARTSEYISTLRLYTIEGHRWSHLLIYGYFAAATLAVIGLYRKRMFAPMAVIVFLAGISVSAFRYLIFFLLIAAPYLTIGLQQFTSSDPVSGKRVRRITESMVLATLSALLLTGMVQGKVFLGGTNPQAIPIEMTNFLERNHLSGRAFNHMRWGGYLIWRLSPALQPYIDGRMLDGARLVPYTHILWATPEGLQWFNEAQFDLVILPYHGKFDPTRYALIDHLTLSAEWAKIYTDHQGVVFKRRLAKQG